MSKFKPGQSGNPATQISGDIAEKMQARSVESRKRNKTLRETLLAALQEDGGEVAGVLGTENPPLGIALLMEGEHLCKTMRGARKPGKMSTCKLTGIFKDEISARNEFLQLARELIKEKV